MGHYTRYRLSVMPAKSDGSLAQSFRFYDDVEMGTLGDLDEESTECIQDTLDSSDTMKWYSYDEDMIQLSKIYPLLTFLLQGEGREDEVDVWRCFYKNGKSLHQNAVLRFDDPDLSLLD